MLGSILPRDDEHQQTPELERLLFFQRREFKPRCGFTPGSGHFAREIGALLFRTSGCEPNPYIRVRIRGIPWPTTWHNPTVRKLREL